MARGRTASRSADAFWSESLEPLLERLGSSREGLAAAESAARLRRQGPNALRVLSGAELSALQDDALRRRAGSTELFGVL